MTFSPAVQASPHPRGTGLDVNDASTHGRSRAREEGRGRADDRSGFPATAGDGDPPSSIRHRPCRSTAAGFRRSVAGHDAVQGRTGPSLGRSRFDANILARRYAAGTGRTDVRRPFRPLLSAGETTFTDSRPSGIIHSVEAGVPEGPVRGALVLGAGAVAVQGASAFETGRPRGCVRRRVADVADQDRRAKSPPCLAVRRRASPRHGPGGRGRHASGWRSFERGAAHACARCWTRRQARRRSPACFFPHRCVRRRRVRHRSA